MNDRGTSAVLGALRQAFPDGRLVTDIEERYLGDWLMRAGPGAQPIALLRPRGTADVASALAICNAHRTPVVPQGGRTGLAGGATPVAGSLLISMELMAGIEAVDAVSQTMTVQAGVPLQMIQEAADMAGLMFPLDIGARGSCQIGRASCRERVYGLV